MFKATKTRRIAPMRMVVHGPPGVGKSTLAASAPSPIFIAAEDGLEEIDATAIEPHPRTYEDVLAAVEHVSTLNYETLVLDSLDWLEPLVWDFTVRSARSAKIKNIEDFGYGKGYVAAVDHWRSLIRRLELLREKGMHVVLIAHSTRKMFKNPIGDDYERWTIKLHEKATELFVEWSRFIAFCDFEVATEDTSGRTKAQTTGRRVLRATPHPSYLAKVRTVRPFPERIALPRERPWDTFAAALAAASESESELAERLRAQLDAAMKKLADNDIEQKARAFLAERGGTVASLSEALETINGYLSERRKAG